jgi:tellurite resistance protein TerC
MSTVVADTMPDQWVWLWLAFIVFIVFLLALDLGVFHRKAHVITLKEALIMSGLWIGAALVFNVFVYFAYQYHWFGLEIPGAERGGRTAAMLFLTGYVVEKSLGIDNLFLIAMIFSYFGVPAVYQHRVLFWGIVGALILRAVMIVAGVALIERFDWTLYLFGTFLIISGVRMAVAKRAPDPEKNPIIALAKRLLPVTHNFVGEKLVVRLNGKLTLTPLALALIMIETSDLIFAIDSIPAVFAVTHDPFLVFTSNIMAVLGMRSLYFALAGIIDRFYYLKLSLALLLALIGTKMLLKDVLDSLPGTTFYTLGAIIMILTGGVIASIMRARRTPESRRVDIPARRKLVMRAQA